jgi:hypothetical protein
MQKNLHLLISNPSTAHLAVNAETPTEEGNAVPENSSDGPLADVPRLNGKLEAQPNYEMSSGEPDEEPANPLIGFLSGIQQTFLQGLKDKLPQQAQVRAAALHTAGLVLGPGATTGDRIVIAQFMLGLDEGK